METLHATSPVFTDDSGKRATALQWVARTLCACFVLVGVAIAFTLVTHVSLPGLGGLLAPSTTDRGSQTTHDEAARGERDPGAGLSPAQRDISTSNPRSQPTAAAVVARRRQAASKTRDSGSAAPASQPQATATPTSTSTTNQPQSQANANPHASAKRANSTNRATPLSTGRSVNPHATAGSANAEPHSDPKPTPPGATK